MIDFNNTVPDFKFLKSLRGPLVSFFNNMHDRIYGNLLSTDNEQLIVRCKEIIRDFNHYSNSIIRIFNLLDNEEIYLNSNNDVKNIIFSSLALLRKYHNQELTDTTFEEFQNFNHNIIYTINKLLEECKDQDIKEKVNSLIQVLPSNFIFMIGYVEDGSLEHSYEQEKLNSFESLKNKEDLAKKNMIESIQLLENTANEIKKSRESLSKVNEEKNKYQNERLLDSFLEEYKDLEPKIQNLNFFIIMFFGIIVGAYFCLFLIGQYPKNTQQYFTYASSLVFFAGLIGYLVRERKRLITFHDYSKKMYLEINALPEYISSLDTDQANQIRINLAHNFFAGNKTEPSEPVSNNDISTVLKYLEDIKKLVNNK
ncbi:hypothetical protein [Acinetobacter pittii]|uniref:hypothetical protein n=1 Tax=Acinetobacter pittii TaxID=48296 RepID=UPI0032EF6F0A